jgi:hypothetical protein
MFGKSQPNRQPKLAGLDEIDIATSETDVPVPYFAGFRKLDISWVMNAVISRTTNADSGGKGGKSAKSGDTAKNYYGHCAGKSCQGQIDFLSGLIVNNELVWPNAFIWDSKIFKANRIVIYTDGNAYKITVETDQVPPNFPWTLYAIVWVAGVYADGDKVVNAGFLFESAHGANDAAPPGTATSSADWIYLSTPALWTAISGDHFWSANSTVAWEGVVYQTPTDTNAQPPNAPWVKFRVLRSASPNPLKTTVVKNTRFGQNAGPGDWYHYWGTPDQVLDVAGEAILNALGHPPYRNCGVTMGKDILFGTQTVTPPTAQVLAGRAPVQALIINNTGVVGVDATALDADWQVNLWTVAAELLTNPVLGLGVPLSWFDAPSWQSEADRCAANTPLFYISPLFTSLKKINEIVSDLLSYADSFIYWTPAGTIAAGHWPHGEAAPAFDATNTINRDNVTKEFDSDSQGWWGTLNSITVGVQDIQAGFKSRPATAPNSWNMAVTRRLLSQTIDRPYITRFSQGVAWATEFAKINGDQSDSGTFEVQAEKATAVRAGSIFLFTDDVLQTSEPQRCTQRVISAPPTGTVKLTRETERGISPQPFSPTPSNPMQATGPSPSAILLAIFTQLPTVLGGGVDRIACLAARNDAFTSALDIWFQQADATAYQQIGRQTGFAVAGNVNVPSGGTNTYSLTANSVLGTTYNAPAGTVLLDSPLSAYDGSGTLLGPFAYGTDYTFDLLAGTITLPLTSTIPNGSTLVVSPFDGIVATASATVGDSYVIPKSFWNYNVWSRAAGAAYTGGFSGSTHRTEGTDYIIDRNAGTITILAGGGISNTDAVFILYNASLHVAFSANTPQADLDQISVPLTQDEINDNEILVFAFQAADPSKFEIMGLTSITAATRSYPALGAFGYVVGVNRQQYGTPFGGDGVYNWTTNDIIFVIPKALLTPLIHESFPGLIQSEGSANFILAPESAWVVADISDLYDPANNPSGLSVLYDYTFSDVFLPSVIWIQQLQNGAAIASFAGAFLTTDVFYFAFQLSAPGANLVNASLTAFLGEQQVTLWSQNFPPSPQQNAAVNFSLGAGLWNVFINVLCDDGNQVSYPLTLPGSAVPVQMTVNTPATTYAPTPIILTYTKKDTNITGLQFGVMPTGLTVKYQLQNRGVALNPASWLTLAESPAGSGKYGTVPNFKVGAKTLYAFSQLAGSTDSAPVSWNL